MSLMEFAYNNNDQSSIGMAPYEALYGRPCRTPVCWGKVGERKLVGPKIVHITTNKVEMIKVNLKAARNQQKSYADNRRRDLEFEVGNKVFLKLSPCKGVLRFGRKGKLSQGILDLTRSWKELDQQLINWLANGDVQDSQCVSCFGFEEVYS